MVQLNPLEMETTLALSAEIKTIRIDGDGGLGPTLAKIRAFLELDNLLLFCPQERTKGWGVERIELDGFWNPTRCKTLLLDYLEKAPYRFWFFDPIHPETDQRDRVVDTLELVGGLMYRSSGIYREVLEPLQLHQHRELRALICDGQSLLGWIGTLHGSPITPEQRMRLNALLPALRCRLAADRTLRTRAHTQAALSAALDRIRQPAFVVGAKGEILATNRSGRARLDDDQATTLAEIDAVQRAQSNQYSERVALRGPGIQPALLIVGPDKTVGYVEECVQRACNDWGLTSRQAEVLRLVARGHSNASIAEQLGVGERAIELHVTVLLERARVTSRTSLVTSLFAPIEQVQRC